jgi:hypothetical protein
MLPSRHHVILSRLCSDQDGAIFGPARRAKAAERRTARFFAPATKLEGPSRKREAAGRIALAALRQLTIS